MLFRESGMLFVFWVMPLPEACLFERSFHLGACGLADITLEKKASFVVGMPFAIRGKVRTNGAGIVKAIIRLAHIAMSDSH